MMKHSNRHKQCHDIPPKPPEELYEEYKRKVNRNANK
jgi:hypothetical protein